MCCFKEMKIFGLICRSNFVCGRLLEMLVSGERESEVWGDSMGRGDPAGTRNAL